ncbi:quinoprotein relay system zinc metallohydrolase 1 (plasmid) [Azospirillum oryzae]|uniref:Quinoprotein relay system zinc metallohydrolase 1 n=1 Tax=Azospirillum oryzae TaxID=286727 RepID=A0A6N1AT32_9PROT|nr:quinoprotein relay system zinc metallohydrolase 1 [Azospirillum oryzae]KAA0585266.1 quinoprotein relay system zinc metallohydrolase 1 [Azospirillum oryzae]QKS54438.1 quinoprotein relay system zinc metallohydrolase 1 [Azospirillum oryzae]GLR79918.1 MBL fold metallo-hydrolase [Azospirillum oryzae]
MSMTLLRRLALTTAFAAVMMVGAATGSARAAGPLTYDLKPTRIAPDTYVFEGSTKHFTRANGGNILNSGFIVTADGVIVIQTGPSRRYGEEMRAAIRKVTEKPIRKVFISNLHPDYWLGSQAFADVPIAALPGTIAGIQEEGSGIADNMYRLVGDWMRGTEVTVPTEPVYGSTVRFGDHRLRLIPLSGHTAADLMILDETTGVLFAGGVVFCDRTPTTPHATVADWLKELDTVDGLDIRLLVPNHGHIRSDKACVAQTRDWLTWLDGTLRHAVDSGLDMAEALELPIPERFEVLDVLREEYRRSVAHLWPKIEQAAMPRVN